MSTRKDYWWGRLYPEFQKSCQCYKKPKKYPYPNMETCTHNSLEDSLPSLFDEETGGTILGNCRPFGYQPKRPNPGGLKFYQYDYIFQKQDGKPLQHPGRGWVKYKNTGKFL